MGAGIGAGVWIPRLPRVARVGFALEACLSTHKHCFIVPFGCLDVRWVISRNMNRGRILLFCGDLSAELERRRTPPPTGYPLALMSVLYVHAVWDRTGKIYMNYFRRSSYLSYNATIYG